MNNVQYFASYCAVAVASGAMVFVLTRPEATVATASLVRVEPGGGENADMAEASPSCAGEDLGAVRLQIAAFMEEARERGEPHTPELEMRAALSVCSVDEIAAIGRKAREDAERLLRQ